MPTNSNQAQFFLEISTQPQQAHQLIYFKSHQLALSQSYQFDCLLLADNTLSGTQLLQQTASLRIEDNLSPTYYHGLITHAEPITVNKTQILWQVKLSSPLSALASQQTNRIFLQKNIQSLLKQFFAQAGFHPTQYCFALNKTDYPVRPLINQYQENDLHFLQRQLADHGLFYYFKQDAQHWQLVICDDVSLLPDANTQSMPYIHTAGMAPQRDCFSQFNCKLNGGLPNQITLQQFNPKTPTVDLTIIQQSNHPTTAGLKKAGQVINHTDNARYYESRHDGQWLAQCAIDRWDCQRQTYQATTNNRSLQPSERILLENHPVDDALAKPYVVTMLQITGTQIASFDESTQQIKAIKGEPSYQATLELIEATQPFRPTLYSRPLFSNTMTATIESRDHLSYPDVDETGYYRIRFPYDHSDANCGHASPPIAKLQALGGQLKNGQQQGEHFALPAGTQVSLRFIQGDLDRPVISAVLHHQAQSDVVNHHNATEHTIRTPSGNTLRMEDKKKQQHLQVSTKDEKNRIRLDASQNHSHVLVESQQGKIQSYAKQDHLVQVGADQTQQIGKQSQIKTGEDLLQQVAGTLTQQAGKDITQQAKGNFHHQVKQSNLSKKAQSQTTQTQGNTHWHAEKSGVQLQATQGDITLQAKQQLQIQAKNTVTLQATQSRIDMTGDNLILTGHKIQLNAPTINVYSESKYQPSAIQADIKAKRKLKVLLDFEQDPQMQLCINQQNNQALPNRKVFDYELTQQQNEGALCLLHQGRQHSLLKDISTFDIDSTGSSRIYLGRLPVKKPASAQKTAKQSPPHQTIKPSSPLVFMTTISKPPLALEENKKYTLNDFSDKKDHGMIGWLLASVNVHRGILDGGTEAGKFFAQKSGRMIAKDFTKLAYKKGADSGILALRKLIEGGSFYVKEVEGKISLIFKGFIGDREFLTAAKYGMKHDKVKIISAKVQARGMWCDIFTGKAVAQSTVQTVKEVSEDVFKHSPINILIVGGLDIGTYFHTPANKRNFGKLVTDLKWDIANVEISGVLGEILTGLIFTGVAILFDFSVGVMAITLSSFLFIGGMGAVVDFVEDQLDARQKVSYFTGKAQTFVHKETQLLTHTIEKEMHHIASWL